MNRRLLILVLAGMLLAPIMSVRAFAVRQVAQLAKAADGAVDSEGGARGAARRGVEGCAASVYAELRQAALRQRHSLAASGL